MASPGAMPRGSSRPAPVELGGGRVLLPGERTLLLAVLNVTPDSFYQLSRTPAVDSAIERALALVAEGADIIDVGGESTRPGASEVAEREELERVLPVIEGIRKRSPVAISVDTRKASVARAALAAGADIVNDVSALGADPEMAGVVASTGAVVILMHARGTPATMQSQAVYEDLMLEVKAELGARIASASRAGIRPERIWIDPGLGFAKTARHSLELLSRLEELRLFEKVLVVGASRKSFLGRIARDDGPEARLEGSLASASVAILKGAQVLRVHDVAATARAARVVEAILDPARID